jgi:hypothetical protein
MVGRRLFLLVILLIGGVVAVWLFGVDRGESLLRHGRPKAKSETTEAGATERAAPRDRERYETAGFEGGTFEIFDELEGRPGVKVLKYLVKVGATDGGVGKRITATTVTIDFFNKQLEPDRKRIAKIVADRAHIEFSDVPDPRSGFRDLAMLGMNLEQNVVVEYLDDAEGTIGTLRCQELVLGDAAIEAPGEARVETQGLEITGTGLTIDRASGRIEFARDNLIRGTRFELPSRSGGGESPAEKPAQDEPADEKTIRCKGAFTFLPEKRDEADAAAAAPGGDLASMLGGGVLTFRDEVVATQDTSTIYCDELEIVLASKTLPPDPAVPGSQPGSTLDVSRMVAKGSPVRRARLEDAMGTFVAETLLLEEKPDGQWITLTGMPEVIDAQFGSREAAAGAAPSEQGFDARATHQLRVRPLVAPAAAAGTPDAATADAAVESVESGRGFLVELEGAAHLERRSANPSERFGLDADRIEMTVRSAPGADEAQRRSSLESLVATGNARGSLEGGAFSGDRIELTPRPPAAGAAAEEDGAAFDLHVAPNPRVELTMPATDDRPASRVAIVTPVGTLRMEPAKDGAGTLARFAGATTMDFYEGDVLATHLDAAESLDIAFGPSADGDGKSGLSYLRAVKDVKLDSPANGMRGSGDELVLEPLPSGQNKFTLRGNLASATIAMDGEARTIEGGTITIDPETKTLHAERTTERSVHVELGSLAIGGSARAAPSAGAAGAILTCDVLDVIPQKGPDGTDQMRVEAEGSVRVDDAANGVEAEAGRLEFDPQTSRLVLHGTPDRKARMRRAMPAEPGKSPSDVEIVGPELHIDTATSDLFCPRNGDLMILRAATPDVTPTRVHAGAIGPIRYGKNRLELANDVLVRFEEKNEEVRALWCDRAVVIFAEKLAEAPPPEGAADGPVTATTEVVEAGDAENATGIPGVERIEATGRVRLHQVEPRPLTANGHHLVWRIVDGEETLFLSGSSPKCWVKGLSNNEHLRYEADSFVLKLASQDYSAENGVFVFEPVEPQR